MTDKKVLLSVLAHPDDESFGMGGTLAYYADQGVEVYLICATRGEVGEVAPEYLKSYHSIGELREAELRCASAHLGLAGIHFMDYRDSGMTGSAENEHPEALINAPLDELAHKVASLIREIKPQVVLTFDPIGGYRHPDHIHIQRATVKAFELAGDANFEDGLPPFGPAKLYFHTISRRFLRVAVRLIKLTGKDPTKWGQNQDIDLTTLAVEDFPVNAKIKYPKVAKQKAAASACHASQGGGGLAKGPLAWIMRLFAGSAADTFMQAYPKPKNDRVVTDLFEGI
ncbi:MAG TPA: GlcNAc-PI de-N-acetylase [Chloroflexi bacterium]|nr:GlcNAc-PI de-N-acetylase [Chloroflexota bacterium]